jgi:hypothetical protein
MIHLDKSRSVNRVLALAALAVAWAALTWFVLGSPQELYEKGGAFQPSKWTLDGHVAKFCWLATTINTSILLGLAAWSGLRKLPTPYQTADFQNPTSARWFWPVVLAAALVLGSTAWNRIDQSLSEDESMSARHFVAGRYVREKHNEPVVMKTVSWKETLFLYDTPNNQVAHNLLARVSNEVWRAVTGAPPGYFSERALRIPALIFGLLGVVAVALFLRDYGWPGAGAIAGWILALHPWYVRYACEARTYSLLMAVLPLCLVAWRRALLTGRWMHWGLFAASEVVLVWCFPAIALFLVLLNAATLVLIFAGKERAELASMQFDRWLTSSCLAGVVALQLLLPLVTQSQKYFAEVATWRDSMDAVWLLNVASYVAAGTPWSEMRGAYGGHPDLSVLAESYPAVWLLLGAVSVFLVSRGASSFARTGEAAQAVFLCFVMALCLQVVGAKFARAHLWPQYFLYFLPFIAALCAVGATSTFQTLGRYAGKPLAATAATCLALLALWATHPIRAWQKDNPPSPLRESAEATGAKMHPADESDQKRETWFFETAPVRAYDPAIRRLISTDHLWAVCARADRKGQEIWVNDAAWLLADDKSPLAKIVTDRRFFDSHRRIVGHNATADRYIFRYIPGSLKQHAPPMTP